MTGKWHSSDCLWDITDYSFGFTDLVYTDRTLQQLKNAGGLRLLSQDDADSIIGYDNMLRKAERNETTEVQETQTLLRNIIYELINFSAVKQKLRHKNDDGMKESPFLYGNSGELINKYFNVLAFYKGIVRNQIENIGALREKAVLLIKYFHNKYHLK